MCPCWGRRPRSSPSCLPVSVPREAETKGRGHVPFAPDELAEHARALLEDRRELEAVGALGAQREAAAVSRLERGHDERVVARCMPRLLLAHDSADDLHAGHVRGILPAECA